ncbi:MAG: hypothetical protein M3453_10985 [Pseudomonadota bacterium]|jgi:hypothetical protein|nr:hypothetical protein [Pseudomonadota bacterium]
MQHPQSEEIREIVANCIENGGILRVGSVGQRLADVHQEQGFSPNLVCEMLLEAGIAAGVALEIASPHPVRTPDSSLGDRSRRQYPADQVFRSNLD